MKILRYPDYRAVPWKNGGGITREILAEEDAAGGGFLWRLSMATVAASGPFSHFLGIDRTIACLDGDGMRLAFNDGREETVAMGGVPLAFPGEADIHADCIGGETLDLNVMTRRDRFRHSLTRIAAEDDLTIAGAPVRAIILDAPATVETATVAAAAGRYDTVLLEPGDHPVTLRAIAGVAAFLVTLIAL
jgi:Uncharacterized protein conserved in bacteria